MKIQIWKPLIAGLIVSTLLAGCKDERDNYMVDDTFSFVSAEKYASVSVYNETYKFAVIKNGKGSQSAKAYLSVAESALSDYNAAKGTNYQLMPENCYKLSTSTLGFSEKEIRKFVEVTWDDAAVFALGKGEYAIPLQLTSDENSLSVDKNRNIIIINPKGASIGMSKILADAVSPSAAAETVSYKGTIALSDPISVMDVTVNYAIDNSLINAYNEANGTTYQAAPSGLVSLAAKSSQIAAGKTETSFEYKIDSKSLFTGNILNAVDNNQYLVPVRISTLSVDGISISNSTMYIPVVMNKPVKGPWKILEGAENCYAKDPNNGGAAWIAQYVADRLFDGDHGVGHEWISWFATPNKFPMTFVVDMGTTRVFTMFKISDYTTHQGNLREYELYTAKEYDATNTQWTLVAKGKRDYAWTATGKVYDFPVQTMAAGRYLKFVIIKAESSTGDYANGRGKLGDVQGLGF